MSIAKEGYPYIFILAGLALAFFIFRFWWIAGIFLILACFVTFFFRDPHRVYSGNERLIVSPADGKIVSIRQENGQEALSIFLSVFDVHINRSPIAGKVSRVEYKKGKFLLAFDERASKENEQNSITIEGKEATVRFVQIAGLIARRIVCWRKEGDAVSAGDKIGLIKFGSRVDVFMPSGTKIQVRIGEHVAGGQTILGELPSK